MVTIKTGDFSAHKIRNISKIVKHLEFDLICSHFITASGYLIWLCDGNRGGLAVGYGVDVRQKEEVVNNRFLWRVLIHYISSIGID